MVVAGDNRIRVLEGLVALMGPKPAAKPPKKITKRALAGGASASGSSSGPARRR